MSLFRNEARREREQGRTGTADIAATGEVRSARPMPDARGDGRADGTAHAEARRAEERLAETYRSTDSRVAARDDDVEDAVEVRRERGDGAAAADGSSATMASGGERLAALFSADVAQGFRRRWDAAQIGFVDDPRRAVQQADELVAEVMKSLAQSFADERRQLETQMRSDSASTENLRVALQRYRSFFQRLLAL